LCAADAYSRILKTKSYCIYFFVALQIIVATYEAVFYWHDAEPSQPLLTAAAFWSLLLLIIWVDADSRNRQGRIYRAYDFGFLIYLLWPFYLPYYFWRTRGLPGLAIFSGLVGLYFLGDSMQWLIYYLH
jgi:drug/metabolite transporter superfamily protein YnfA